MKTENKPFVITLIALLLFASLLVTASPIQAETWTSINLPYTITASGNYKINSSWTGSGVGLSVNASNVVVDGQNFALHLTQNDTAVRISSGTQNVLLENINQTFGYIGLKAYSGNFTVLNSNLNNNTYAIVSNDTKDFTVKDSILSNCTYGLFAFNASGYTLKNCLLNNTLLGLWAEESKNFVVENSTLRSNLFNFNTAGLFAMNSSNFIIKQCDLSKNPIGLEVLYSRNFTIESCTFDHGLAGVDIGESSNFSIRDSSINDQLFGMLSSDISDFNIQNCNFTQCMAYGTLTVTSASNFSMQNVNIKDGRNLGLQIVDSSNFNVTSSRISEVFSSDSWSCAGMYCLNATNFNVKNTSIFNNTNGFFVYESKNFTVENTNITNNEYEGSGFYLTNNTIMRNLNVNNNAIGMDAFCFNNASFQNCNFNNNTWGGLGIDSCDNLNLTANVFANNGITLGSSYGGLQVCNSNCTITNNRLANNFDALLWMVPSDYSIENATTICASNIFENNNCTFLFNYELPSNYTNQKLRFYNNLVNDTAYVDPQSFNSTYTTFYAPPSSALKLNCTMQLATRVYSLGSRIGGNFWAHPNGTGFSQTATDANNDGFIDQAFDLFGNGTVRDYLPYSTNVTAFFVYTAGTVQSLYAGETSSAVTVQLRDAFGNITTGITFNLASNSSTGKFYLDNSVGGKTVANVTILSGASTGSFYFLDITVGSPTITVSAQGTNATTTKFTIIPVAAKILPSPTPEPTASPSPSPSPTSTATPTPIPTPTPSPTFTITAATGSGATVELAINGNITASQISGTTITTDQTSQTTTISFTVTGESGNLGFSNITVPKSAVPNGSTPIIYIDHMQVADQGYCEDNVNFYVWFTTTFSTHQIDITFRGQPQQPIQTQKQDMTLVYIIVIVVVAVGVPLEVLLLWKKPKKNRRSTASFRDVSREQFISSNLFSLLLLTGENYMSTQPFHVTDSNFEETIKKNKLVFIDFWASWCGPCRALAPTIEELAKEYSGKALVGKLDVDENPATAERFQVFSIPTMILFKDGTETERLVGLCPKGKIADTLNKHQ